MLVNIHFQKGRYNFTVTKQLTVTKTIEFVGYFEQDLVKATFQYIESGIFI